MNKITALTDQLIESSLFKGFYAAEVENLLEKVQYQIKFYDEEQVIALRNDPCNSLNFVLEGSVRGEMYRFDGKTIKVEDIPAPEPFASAFLFGDKQKYPVSVVANEASKVLKIGKQDFLRIIQEDGKLLNNYMDKIASRAQLLADKLWFINFNSLREKIASFVLDRCEQENEYCHTYTQSQLADLFGVARPSLSREINKMVKEGLIKNYRNKIIMLDKQAILNIVR